MKSLQLLLSILTCAVSFPTKVIKGEWPTISMEEATQPGDFIHRQNSYWVTTVRGSANFYAKAWAFEHLLILLAVLLL